LQSSNENSEGNDNLVYKVTDIICDIKNNQIPERWCYMHRQDYIIFYYIDENNITTILTMETTFITVCIISLTKGIHFI